MHENERMTKMTKKILTLCLALALAAVTGCTSTTKNSTESTEPAANKAAGSFDSSSEITVVSREDGSGTRGAFIELFGIEEKGADGTKKDNTTKDAIIANKTDVNLCCPSKSIFTFLCKTGSSQAPIVTAGKY